MATPSVELLKRVPLFADLEPRELQRLASQFKERQVHAGETISSEGAGAAGFFVIDSGTARVSVRGEERTTIGPGDYFGEIALIDEGARSATICRRHRSALLRNDVLGVPAARRGRCPNRVEAPAGTREEAPGGRRPPRRLSRPITRASAPAARRARRDPPAHARADR